jgi:hypothetical protein
MGEVELTARLATGFGAGLLLLGGIVWRDEDRFDDGWLIVTGYSLAISAAIAAWTGAWWFVGACGFLYKLRRRWLQGG